jgi:leucyl/phenylalanyl-tRNA--protein transferase
LTLRRGGFKAKAMALDPDLLLHAYSIGVFPMAESRDSGKIIWIEPRRRAIIPLDRFHMSRSLRKTVRAGTYQVTRDAAFPTVVRRCADRSETWINAEIEASYLELHRLGHAHSVECWLDGELAGGLYGVKHGAAFFGESMFSLRPDASKVALAWLVARLIVGGYRLLDCQFMTEHLKRLGAVEISQKDYLALLASALTAAAPEGAFVGDVAAAIGGGGGTEGGRDGAPVVEFGALDRLLAADPARTVDSPASGWVIAQLLGHTS